MELLVEVRRKSLPKKLNNVQSDTDLWAVVAKLEPYLSSTNPNLVTAQAIHGVLDPHYSDVQEPTSYTWYVTVWNETLGAFQIECHHEGLISILDFSDPIEVVVDITGV